MKRKYEVAYYECGLTNRIRRKFFHRLIAYLYKGYLDYRFEGMALVEINEL